MKNVYGMTYRKKFMKIGLQKKQVYRKKAVKTHLLKTNSTCTQKENI